MKTKSHATLTMGIVSNVKVSDDRSTVMLSITPLNGGADFEYSLPRSVASAFGLDCKVQIVTRITRLRRVVEVDPSQSAMVPTPVFGVDGRVVIDPFTDEPFLARRGIRKREEARRLEAAVEKHGGRASPLMQRRLSGQWRAQNRDSTPHLSSTNGESK